MRRLVWISLCCTLAAAGATSAPAFPLKVSANRGYLVDQHGKPFFVMGDTPWFVQKQKLEDVRMLMDDRIAKGYNTLFLELLDDEHIPPIEGYGNTAFSPATDITKPVETYWRYAEQVLDAAAQRGLFVMHARSTVEAPHLLKLLGSLIWWKLAPDVKHEFVSAGFGQWKKADYLTAALAEDGSCGAVYLPVPRTFTADLSKLKLPVKAQWFDPTTGTCLLAAGSPFSKSGAHVFIPPGQNAASQPDWVLAFTTQKH